MKVQDVWLFYKIDGTKDSQINNEEVNTFEDEDVI